MEWLSTKFHEIIAEFHVVGETGRTVTVAMYLKEVFWGSIISVVSTAARLANRRVSFEQLMVRMDGPVQPDYARNSAELPER